MSIQSRIRPVRRWTDEDTQIIYEFLTEDELEVVYKGVCHMLKPKTKSNPIYQDIVFTVDKRLNGITDKAIRKMLIKQTLTRIRRFYKNRGLL